MYKIKYSAQILNFTARVVERVNEIEEGATGEEQMVQCMKQITVWQRIEALSYTYIRRTVRGQVGYYVYILHPGGNTH